MNRVSEGSTQKPYVSSTPTATAAKLTCTISSISGSDSTSSSSNKNSASRTRSRVVKDRQDNYEDKDDIAGDVIRDAQPELPDIQPCNLQPIFYHLEPDDSTYNKLNERSNTLRFFSLSDDYSFTGIVGEHRRTYKRIPNRTKILSFFKEKPFPIFTERKFFKSRGKRLLENNMNKCPSKKKLKCHNYFISYSRPLGWMAIKGIGLAERLEVADSPDFSIDPIRPYKALPRN